MSVRRKAALALWLASVAACGDKVVERATVTAPAVVTAKPAAAPRSTVDRAAVTTTTGSVPPPAASQVDRPAPVTAPAAAVELGSPTTVQPAEAVWPPFEPLPGVDGIAALTGLAGDPETTLRPALVVKIDNHRKARPQIGIEAADIVFEENVEGITRFVAVFHSRRPDTIGPVRSARSSDLSVLASLNRPVLAWSGGNPGVTRAVRAAVDSGVLVDLSALREGGCFRRDGSRPKPHNLVLDPVCALARAGDAGAARPPWSIAADWVSPSPYGPDSTFSVPMDGVAVAWTWVADRGVYERSQDGAPHLGASGVLVATSNVVVLEVRHVASSIDTRSPEAITTGTGDGVVHRDGLATLVHWSRPTAQEPFTLTTRDGAPVALDVGSTFVELMRAP